MKVTSYLLLILGAILDVVFIIVDDKTHGKASVYLKTLASLMFVLLGINNYHGGLTYMIIITLVFDMLGDFILILRNIDKKHHDLFYIIGTLSFFVAHIILIIYLLNMNVEILLTGILVTTLLFIIFSLRFINTLDVNRTFRIIGTLYLYVILLTFFLSLILSIMEFNLANAILTVALYTFTFSDVILIIQKFRDNSKTYMQPLYRASYYLSQLLLTLFIFLK